ncbi:aminoglycoside phosphotransferase family protein [Streptomyces sp. UNOC14_S4]|uniref:aminoglycoside phosphotransferase family protein n=1 Tax=Streptomyces sp. UNOC14_S4 TaxID=2872340 RepID=UPI001E3180DC|nr:aminoglycoside phosphotransferase family protein [Streptomyces sp. UNOC14_S4]MCC3772342.1 aminoglycoside phosphotransferase family protein [Streptomyces sp. UNOC14_S4]
MFSAPDDVTVRRMRTARAFACATLALTDLTGNPVWGYGGRTLSGAVTGGQGVGWLRVVAERPDRAHGKLWDGPKAARELLPPEIPRPVLHHVHDWQAADWAYRAELYQHADATTISRSPVLEHDPVLPGTWWAELRTALDSLAEAPTERVAVREEYIRRAVPAYTGHDVGEIVWSTAHGDFHWSNIGGPGLTILDWEGWGRAPVAFDAAQLYVYSLRTPATAARVRRAFAHVLDTPPARVAELTVCAQVLQAADRTPFYKELAGPVKEYLDAL